MYGEIGPLQGEPYSKKELEKINFLEKMEKLSISKNDEVLAYEVEQMLFRNGGFYPDYWKDVVDRFNITSGSADCWHWPRKNKNL